MQDIRLRNPISKAKLPSPLILNSGFINLLKTFPKYLGIWVLLKTSIATKKGKREGTIDVAHNFSPDFPACIFAEENKTRQIEKSKKNKEIKFFLTHKTITLNFFI